MDNSAQKLPHDEEIEKAIIGCMINDEQALAMAQANYDIEPEMFYHPAHQTIVRTIYEVSKRGYVDVLLLQNDLKKQGVYEEIGGAPYLMHCMELSPISANLTRYCEELKSYYQKRRVIQTATCIMADAYQAENGQEFLMGVPQQFFDLMPKTGSESSLADSLQASVDQWRKIKDGDMGMPGLSTGIAQLDETLTGLKPGSYNIIAARPSAGKTSLAGDILNYQCGNVGNAVAWVNMDMPRSDLEQRWLCRRAGVSLPKLNAGHAGESNFAKIEQAKREISEWPLHALHATRDVAKICAWIRLKVKREGVKLVVIDYIQKCTADHIRSHDPVRVISYSSAAIKELCQELNVPVLVLAQLGRADKNDRRPPTLDSLKGCGDLEQDAQVAMLLYKYEKFDYVAANVNQVTDRAIVLDVAKQQNGGIGQMEFWFRTSYFTMQYAPRDWGYPECVG